VRLVTAKAATLHGLRDRRAIVAVDLGAESCRVSLLRWKDDAPQLTLVHRFPNGPYGHDGLRWPLRTIEEHLDQGLRQCAALAPEGIRSIAMDGWAVDYVRLDANGQPLAEPFCYRDERTTPAQEALHRRISALRLREITGVQISRINTLYQLCADTEANFAEAAPWLNLPEYMLTRWGGDAVAEYTNATHTEMVDLRTRRWSPEIFEAAQLDIKLAPRIVEPGSRVGKLQGRFAALPALRDTDLIAPACHDTASAIAGIPIVADDWAYISSGTWSLVGTLLPAPCARSSALDDGFTNLGAIGGQTCFHKNLNGMWLLKQCMESWAAAGGAWDLNDLLIAAQHQRQPSEMLDLNDPSLLLVGDMPQRINHQRHELGFPALDESATGAPEIASLIFHSLAEEYANVLEKVEHHTGRTLRRIVIVGGGSRNDFLCELVARRTDRTVVRGSAESSTVGNLAIQLAAAEGTLPANTSAFASEVARWAESILMHEAPSANSMR
jgi:rhamnulokinase